MNERVDQKRQAVAFQTVRNYLGEQFLFKPRDAGKFRADAASLEFVKSFTQQRQTVFIRQLHFEPEIIAGKNIVVPFGQTAADANLSNERSNRFAVAFKAKRGQIERESDKSSLFNRHRRI